MYNIIDLTFPEAYFSSNSEWSISIKSIIQIKILPNLDIEIGIEEKSEWEFNVHIFS